MADHAPAHPPRARLAFRVGVVGHRMDRLPETKEGRDAIKGQIGLVLDELDRAVKSFYATDEAKALYRREDPVLRAVSPLAEGADRMFARAALDRGYELCVPMPFAREEYAKDFEKTGGSIDEFNGLIARAKRDNALTIFELCQARQTDDDEGVPYGNAGRVVVNQSDLLVAIWDGGKGRGKGGTVTTMKEAVGFSVPVLHIDARAPYGCSLIQSDDDIESCLRSQCTAKAMDEEALRAEIRTIVRAELALPRTRRKHAKRRWFQFWRSEDQEQDEAAEARQHAHDYFDEKERRWTLGFWWKLFRDTIGDFPPGWPAIKLPPFLERVRYEWPVKGDPEPGDSEKKPPKPTTMASWVNQRLRVHYAWADGLANHFGDAHRSGFLWTSALAATAVFLALIPVVVLGFPIALEDSADEAWWIIGELVVLGMLFLIGWRGRTRRWHERWLEYRMLAEWVRQLRFVIPMGGARPLMRTPAHLAVYGDPKHSWAYWHVRAVARETGIPNAKADARYVRDCLKHLDEIVGDEGRGQCHFHTKSQARSHRIHHWLHFVTAGLVIITLVSVALHWWLATYEPERLPFCIDPHGLAGVLLVLSAGLPAASAALANIDNQGEFARLSKRARAMADAFRHYGEELGRLTKRLGKGNIQAPTMVEVTSLASRIATTMVEEFIDWRIVAIDLPHEPG